MPIRTPNDILICFEEEKAKQFIEKVWGLNPTFICVIGNTETAKIPRISAAGKYPELTDYTPAADVELLFYGRCKCIKGVPVTPEGIPTPALITMSAVRVADIPVFVVNAGVKVKPHIPFIEVEGSPGNDIRTGRAVKDPEKIFQRSVLLGESFAKISDYLVIGESIPGGTTTALGVLLAMGIDAEGKVSSSMPNNPHDLKLRVVKEGLASTNVDPERLKKDPLVAASAVGDPMMVAFAGLVVGAAKRIPVVMAGGTQMAAVLAIVKGKNPNVLENVVIGTTRWIIDDNTSDLIYLVSQIARVPVLAANLNFSYSKYDGLQMYEKGAVKEGVGAGGATIASILKSKGNITCKTILSGIEKNYERLLSLKH